VRGTRRATAGEIGALGGRNASYENFIGGKWQAPAAGRYRNDVSAATAGPITGEPTALVEARTGAARAIVVDAVVQAVVAELGPAASGTFAPVFAPTRRPS